MKTSSFYYLWVSLFIATLTMLCPQTICASGASSEEINNAIVLDGSIPLTWENDKVYPWIVEQNKIQSGNAGNKNSISSIKMRYASQYPTTLDFTYTVRGGNSENRILVYVDGTRMVNDYGEPNGVSKSFRIPKGNHMVEFRDSVYNTSATSLYSQIYDVKVTEYPGASVNEINESILQGGSLPVTWTLDENYPWRLVNGKLQSSNWGFPNSSSSVSFQYNSQYPTTLDFKYDVRGGNSENRIFVYVDGTRMVNDYGEPNGVSKSFRIPKGNHTVEFRDTVYNTSATSLYSQIYDVKVTEYPGASLAEIKQSIVQDGSIELQWEQDQNYPWRIVNNKLQNGNFGFANTSSTISFKYNSEFPTTIQFKYDVTGGNSSNHCKISIDGNILIDDYSETANSRTYYMTKGQHKVEFTDTVYNTTSYYYTNIFDVKVTESKSASEDEIANNIVKDGSLPIRWTNDSEFPWTINGGYLRNSNARYANTSSSIKAQFSIDTPSKFGFSHHVGYNSGNSDHILRFFVNNEEYVVNNSSTDWQTYYTVLTPGTYTLEWRYDNKTSGANYYAQIKDIELTQDWIEVSVTPGMLGVEVLYKVNVLQDVKMLKIKGALNSSDWANIKQMTNLYALDISETQVESIADETFNGLRRIKYVKLPDGLKTIGASAFKNSGINTIDIPASVSSIGNDAFYGSYIRHINIPESSKMTSVGEYAFYRCNLLKEFIMPNSVTAIGQRAFYECTALNKMVFSDALTSLPDYCCYSNSAVIELHLPNSVESIGSNFMYAANSVRELILPETLRSIGQNAFAGLHQVETLVLPERLNTLGSGAFHNSANIKTVELPSGVTSYNGTFSGCTNIKTVICRAATPPTISSDPFSSITKANVTLKVPSFSVASYKLDSYWYKFGNIIEGDPVDYWKIIGDLKLLNNRRMEGKPDIDLYYGGKLTIGGDAPMEVGKLDIYTSEGSPSSLVSDCNAFTADEINTIFKVDANKWYFITPMVDIDLRQVNVSGTANYVFRYYDGATRADIGAGTSWKNVSDMTLKAGVGYIFQCNAASDITFPVAVELRSKILSTNAFTLPLTAHPSDNAANKGWNYVGNPYPSYYDIYYMDFTAPITVWTGSTYRAYSIADDNYVLRPMQGFFVQKPDAVDAITLQVAGRQIESTVNRSSTAKVRSRVSTENTRAVFNIEIGGEEAADMTRVVLNDNAELGYEIECDASKFMSMDDAVAQIYTIDNADNKLAINERPTDDGVVSLGIYIPNSNDEYVISASRMDGNAILVDKENETEHDLANGGYKFTSMSEGVCEGRFALKLKSDITSGINGISAGNAVVETVADGIVVKGAQSIFVYGTDGVQLYNNASVSGDVHIELTNGIYVVVANGKSYKVAVK